MYYLGLDIGSSSIKAAMVEISSGKSVGVAQEPETEMGMLAIKNGWAEQKPEEWWKHVCAAIMDNDHVMTFMPFKDKEPYTKAYQNWKQELELVINK